MSISLKTMLAEAFFYDVGTEKNQFESAVATATEQAKKKFEESMKQKVLNQKVKVRASRGQPGQPEKDYVIDKVSSASIDWYWKQYVVVFKDEKNKEYFLKPGFKVEVLSAAAAGGEQPTNQTPAEPQKPAAQPSPAAPGTKPQSKPATGAPAAPAPDKTGKPPVAEVGEPDVQGDNKEYKKEWVAETMGEILFDFLSPEKQRLASQQHPARVVLPYVKSARWVGDETGNADSPGRAEWILEIPVEDMSPDVDIKDLQLAISTGLRSYSGPGQDYTRGYADINKLGRLYRITVEYTVGLDV